MVLGVIDAPGDAAAKAAQAGVTSLDLLRGAKPGQSLGEFTQTQSPELMQARIQAIGQGKQLSPDIQAQLNEQLQQQKQLQSITVPKPGEVGYRATLENPAGEGYTTLTRNADGSFTYVPNEQLAAVKQQYAEMGIGSGLVSGVKSVTDLFGTTKPDVTGASPLELNKEEYDKYVSSLSKQSMVISQQEKEKRALVGAIGTERYNVVQEKFWVTKGPVTQGYIFEPSKKQVLPKYNILGFGVGEVKIEPGKSYMQPSLLGETQVSDVKPKGRIVSDEEASRRQTAFSISQILNPFIVPSAVPRIGLMSSGELSNIAKTSGTFKPSGISIPSSVRAPEVTLPTIKVPKPTSFLDLLPVSIRRAPVKTAEIPKSASTEVLSSVIKPKFEMPEIPKVPEELKNYGFKEIPKTKEVIPEVPPIEMPMTVSAEPQTIGTRELIYGKVEPTKVEVPTPKFEPKRIEVPTLDQLLGIESRPKLYQKGYGKVSPSTSEIPAGPTEYFGSITRQRFIQEGDIAESSKLFGGSAAKTVGKARMRTYTEPSKTGAKRFVESGGAGSIAIARSEIKPSATTGLRKFKPKSEYQEGNVIVEETVYLKTPEGTKTPAGPKASSRTDAISKIRSNILSISKTIPIGSVAFKELFTAGTIAGTKTGVKSDIAVDSMFNPKVGAKAYTGIKTGVLTIPKVDTNVLTIPGVYTGVKTGVGTGTKVDIGQPPTEPPRQPPRQPPKEPEPVIPTPLFNIPKRGSGGFFGFGSERTGKALIEHKITDPTEMFTGGSSIRSRASNLMTINVPTQKTSKTQAPTFNNMMQLNIPQKSNIPKAPSIKSSNGAKFGMLEKVSSKSLFELDIKKPKTLKQRKKKH